MRKIIWLIRAFVYKMFFWNMKGVLYLGQPTYFLNVNRIIFGKNFRIYPHARIELTVEAYCKFGDNVAIGNNFHLISGHEVKIGDNLLCSSNVFISDTDHSFELSNTSFMEQPCQFKSISIGNNVFLGKNAVILPGTCLGNNTVVAANAVVKGRFPDNVVLAGVPAKIIKIL